MIHEWAMASGVTWQAYGENLEEKLTDLHDRIHKGSYRARPARRTYIPKADGSQRPLAILCLEDKVVQQAVATVLEAIYEEDFVGFSYGFRPGRGQHDALDALHVGILRKRVNWVLDADIQGFYVQRTSPRAWGLRLREAPHPQAIKRGGCCLLLTGTRSAPWNSTRFAAQYPACGIP
jgi:Reverse transcriptase (RNA-dependent DNA polymerase)